jgi:hypothetical protein
LVAGNMNFSNFAFFTFSSKIIYISRHTIFI